MNDERQNYCQEDFDTVFQIVYKRFMCFEDYAGCIVQLREGPAIHLNMEIMAFLIPLRLSQKEG